MTAMTAAEALARAEALFRAGQFDQMDGLCRSVLEAVPAAADAHRLLGLSAYAPAG